MTVSQKLPEVLLEKSITFHTRKGLRDWCDCEYCRVKRSGTNEIAHTGTWMHYDHPRINQFSNYDNWELWAAIIKRRKDKAKKLRQELNELKLKL